MKRLREKEGEGVGEIMDCEKRECEARFEKKEGGRQGKWKEDSCVGRGGKVYRM